MFALLRILTHRDIACFLFVVKWADHVYWNTFDMGTTFGSFAELLAANTVETPRLRIANTDEVVPETQNTENAIDFTSPSTPIQPIQPINPTAPVNQQPQVPQGGKSLVDRVKTIEDTMFTKEMWKQEKVLLKK